MTLTQKAIANYYLAKFKMMDFCERAKEEELGISEIVVVIILIAVAVGVALLFKDKIAEFINEFFNGLNLDTAKEKATTNP